MSAIDDVADSIGDALERAANIYGQVQGIRTGTYVQRAQASGAAFGEPNKTSNPQAKNAQAVAVPFVGTLSGTGMLLAFVALGVGVYLLARD